MIRSKLIAIRWQKTMTVSLDVEAAQLVRYDR